MYKSSLLKLSLILMILNFSALAAKPKIKDAGIPLNTQAPEISVVDIEGNSQTIKQLSGAKGLILVFFRSADWCPYCKRHLVEINEWNTKFNKLGYKTAAISYDSIDILAEFTKKQNLQYPLVSDQQQKTMKALNVLNDEEEVGGEHYGIPFPGVMVIDGEGKLTYKYFYKGYKKRVKMKELYKRLVDSI